jgi:hypothetical protein
VWFFFWNDELGKTLSQGRNVVLIINAIQTSWSVIGFKFELNLSEIRDASFNSVNVKPVTQFQDGVRAATQNTDVYVEFKGTDNSRGFFLLLFIVKNT